MKTQCPSCHAQCWFSDEAVMHRTRCKTCGTTIVVDATPKAGMQVMPDAISNVPIVMSLSRRDPRDGSERTLLLRGDCTTELREGSRDGRVLSMSKTTRQTTSTWLELGEEDLARLARDARDDGAECEYVLETANARVSFVGRPADEDGTVCRMLTGLWATVDAGPLWARRAGRE